MARISSTTLFNFTDSLDFLISNLKDGFYCSSITETLPVHSKGYRVPMTCFCDIPLSLIKDHFEWYGRYGIGIKLAYGRLQGLRPVWYITKEGELVKNMMKNKNLPDYEKNYLLPYLKKFKGLQLRSDGKLVFKKFYDEKEWRYIPKDSIVQPLFGLKSQTHINKEHDKVYRMALDLNQVEYIILKDDADYGRMLQELKNLSERDNILYETLVSKLITSRQIDRDF